MECGPRLTSAFDWTCEEEPSRGLTLGLGLDLFGTTTGTIVRSDQTDMTI